MRLRKLDDKVNGLTQKCVNLAPAKDVEKIKEVIGYKERELTQEEYSKGNKQGCIYLTPQYKSTSKELERIKDYLNIEWKEGEKTDGKYVKRLK